jgi:hypothetical protein
MKNLFLLLLLNCFFCQAQTLNFDKIDEFTGNRKISIGINNVSSTFSSGVAFDILYVGNNSTTNYKFLNITIATASLLCYRDSKVICLFEDGTQATINQFSKTECGKLVTITYLLKEADIISFTNLKLKKLRIYSTDGYFDCEVKEKKKQQIIDGFIKFNMTVPN